MLEGCYEEAGRLCKKRMEAVAGELGPLFPGKLTDWKAPLGGRFLGVFA